MLTIYNVKKTNVEKINETFENIENLINIRENQENNTANSNEDNENQSSIENFVIMKLIITILMMGFRMI